MGYSGWKIRKRKSLKKNDSSLDSYIGGKKKQSDNILSVAEITRYIRDVLEYDKNLSKIFVKGEVSNLRKQSSGHIYFSLKDDKSQIKCVFFKRSNEDLKFDLEDGMNIIVMGDIEVYEPRGEYSIIVKQAYPQGDGALHIAFIQLKKKLEKEGLFSQEYKKKIPEFPRKIGVITSGSGAALHDILNVVKKRYPVAKIAVFPTIVQGEKSASDIVDSLNLANKFSGIDVIILGRGGGSLEDLWSFNEEKVVRAIFESKIPIISAVGHETDFTISDFVADVRAPTPSAAAEIAVPDKEEIKKRLNYFKEKGSREIQNKLNFYKHWLEQIKGKFIFKKPFELIYKKYQEVDQKGYEINNSILKILSDKKKKVEILGSKIEGLNPEAILERGYGIVMSENKILKNSFDVNEGNNIKVILSKGELDAEVKRRYEKRR